MVALHLRRRDRLVPYGTMASNMMIFVSMDFCTVGQVRSEVWIVRSRLGIVHEDEGTLWFPWLKTLAVIFFEWVKSFW